MRYCTKKALYNFVASLKNKFGVSDNLYPLDLGYLEDISSKYLSLELASFKTRGLCGVAFIGDKEDTVILNSERSENEQLFDFSHELVHLSAHRHVGAFQCFDKVKPAQNSFLEWQANEGAAEITVPYKLFIPQFVDRVRECGDSWFDYIGLKWELADEFGVTPAIISYRIDNLRYEISQYEKGISIGDLQLKSNTQLIKEGIIISSYNQKYMELQAETFEYVYQ